jgi:hypothetical protein
VINPITVALNLEIMMNLHEMGWDEGGMDRIDLAQDRDCWLALVNSLGTLGFHKMRDFLTKLEPVSFSRRTLTYWND